MRIIKVVEEQLKKDLQLTDMRIGDVLIDIKQEWYFYKVLEDSFKISVKAEYKYDVHGSHFKTVKVEPAKIDAYMIDFYPALLKKVKAAVEKIQGQVDAIKEARVRADEARQQHAIAQINLVKETGLSEFLLPCGITTIAWQTKDEKMRVELHKGKFNIVSSRLQFTPEQMKRILEIAAECK